MVPAAKPARPDLWTDLNDVARRAIFYAESLLSG
jgi:hypothetical protein